MKEVDEEDVDALHAAALDAIERRGDLAGGTRLLARAVAAAPSRAQLCYEYARCLHFGASDDEAWEVAAAFVHGRVQASDGAFREHCTLHEIALVLLTLLLGYLVRPDVDTALAPQFYPSLVRWFCRLPPPVLEQVHARFPVTLNFAAVVVALLPLRLPVAPGIAPGPPVVALGDSHILPLAWQPLRARADSAGPTRVRPLLCVGLKAWTLASATAPREDAILRSHLAALDDALDAAEVDAADAVCIVCAGEIDCRPGSGMARAVQSGHHATLRDAIEATACGYVARLTNEAAQRPRVRLVVHSVRPARRGDGEAQRDAIEAFNACLAREIAGTAGRVAFADVTPELVDDGFLRDAYCNPSDEVHLAPAYVPVLERVLCGLAL